MTTEEAVKFAKEAAAQVRGSTPQPTTPPAPPPQVNIKEAMAVSAIYGLQLLQNKIYGTPEE